MEGFFLFCAAGSSFLDLFDLLDPPLFSGSLSLLKEGRIGLLPGEVLVAIPGQFDGSPPRAKGSPPGETNRLGGLLVFLFVYFVLGIP